MGKVPILLESSPQHMNYHWSDTICFRLFAEL